MDGVRMNQPFGDVVSWDLIPKVAIDSMTLMPGSNPLFGLNTLGGSLSLRTKDGIDWPGSAVQLSVGSYGRRALELEHGFRAPAGSGRLTSPPTSRTTTAGGTRRPRTCGSCSASSAGRTRARA
jgi:hypothetical protein